MTLVLLRVGQTEKGTQGVLRYGGVAFALTFEPPWKDNKQNISCIPAGSYMCQRVQSPQFGNTFEIENVPGRTVCRFHKGNKFRDTKGCVLVGEEFSGTYDLPELADSKHGFDEFMTLMHGRNQFKLIILDPPLVGDEAA